MQVNGTGDRMFRVKAVARILDVSGSTVYRLAASGRLHSARVGVGKGALRIPATSLNAYLVGQGLSPLRVEPSAEGAIA